MNQLTNCLCCEGDLLPLIDFGLMPLVNTYSVLEKYPLAVNRCVQCCHLQLDKFVDPAILYSDYTYCSGTGRTAFEYFRMFAQTAVSYFPQARNVLDIASNDGSQLDAFKTLGLDTFGVDPAANLADIAVQKDHVIKVAFLEDADFASDRTFDLITAQNVLAHTPKPLEFLKKCFDLMHDNSKLFIATSQANMVVNGECDTIYHEHVSYFNAHSMLKLAARAGLTVLDIIMHDIHGTSYVFVLGKTGAQSERVNERLDWEFLTGMTNPSLYRWWKDHIHRRIAHVHHQITDYKKKGYYTVGCGAAAKGISMLNMAGVKLDVLADNTPTKIGRTASGMEIMAFNRIVTLKHEKILFVLLAWNVAVELKQNVLKLRNNSADVFIEAR